MKITVIGTGYVGLVTGSCFSSMGNYVTCVDIDDSKISDLNNGVMPIFEPGLEKIIKESTDKKLLYFSSDLQNSIKDSSIIFIAVGTPELEDGSVNLDFILKTAKDIGRYINSEQLIIVKSTVPVGTTLKIKKIIQSQIRKRDKSINFNICNNPEFLKQGKAVGDFMSPDRIVIGLDNNSAVDTLKKLYKPFSINHDKLIFMDIASSELTKYAANAMLATKISFMNEMAIIAEKTGADINKVRLGIGSDNRIGYSFIYPSVGYGGSCFPKDVRSVVDLSEKKGYTPQILKSVDFVNSDQKKYFFKKVFDRFKTPMKDFKGLKFAIWGLSFKPGTDDMRESASIYIINKIINLRGEVLVYDPKAMNNAQNNYFKGLCSITYCSDKSEALKGSDALILLTEWPEFRSPDFEELKRCLKSPVIFDGRNQYDKSYLDNLGFEYHQIGVKS